MFDREAAYPIGVSRTLYRSLFERSLRCFAINPDNFDIVCKFGMGCVAEHQRRSDVF
jgi:hypothetical protein